MLNRLVFESAHQLALVPLAWLVLQHLRGRDCDASSWWIAFALAVSWIADLGADLSSPALMARVYPVSQAAIMALVFAARRDAVIFLGLLGAAGLLGIALNPLPNDDLLLRVVAFGGVCAVALTEMPKGALQRAVLAYFGLGLGAWMGYVIHPSYATWGVYQMTRVVGIGLLCRAMVCIAPPLRVVA